MKIKPENNWILVEIVDVKQEQESMVLLPEDYKKTENPYKVVNVLEDSRFEYFGKLVVPTHIIRDIQVGSETFHLIERNHIMAAVLEG
jgi:co-chaperonin GroES (HSP10)